MPPSSLSTSGDRQACFAAIVLFSCFRGSSAFRRLSPQIYAGWRRSEARQVGRLVKEEYRDGCQYATDDYEYQYRIHCSGEPLYPVAIQLDDAAQQVVHV